MDSISSAEEQRLWVCDIIAQRQGPISVCDIIALVYYITPNITDCGDTLAYVIKTNFTSSSMFLKDSVQYGCFSIQTV